MMAWLRGVWCFWRRLRQPPIGWQQGRRERFVRMFPMVCWVYYLLAAYTTPRLFLYGIAGVGPLLLFALLGFETRALLFGYLLIAWVIVCIVAGRWWRPRLLVTFEAPLRVECGSRFTTRYTLHNCGRRSARDLAVETIVYSDWMSLRLERTHLACLPPGISTTLESGGRALARGVFFLPALRYDSAFPSGFWRWGRTLPHQRVLSVYPRYTRLISFDIPLGVRRRQEFSAARELSREALEFHGCREYREGDDLRHVHPRSSARLGVPVIKEFQAEGRSRTALVVDTCTHDSLTQRVFSRATHASPIEAALSLAAAVTDALAATDRILELLVAGNQLHHFVSQGRSGYLEEALDVLAAIEPARRDAFDGVASLLLAGTHEIDSVCLILIGWNEKRAQLVQMLEALEISYKLIIVTNSAKQRAKAPVAAEYFTPHAVLSGEVVTL